MQSAWSGIWTRVAVSISYYDNHCTTGTSFSQPLHTGRIWHKVNFLAEFNRFEFRVFPLLEPHNQMQFSVENRTLVRGGLLFCCDVVGLFIIVDLLYWTALVVMVWNNYLAYTARSILPFQHDSVVSMNNSSAQELILNGVWKTRIFSPQQQYFRSIATCIVKFYMM